MDKPWNDRTIKWLILLIPTLTIGSWEYVRHAFLLPYISMELGNLLAPFIVLAVTLTLVRILFGLLEQSQGELQREKAANAALEERERLARELHDGIAQSLFLLAVKLNQLDRLSEEQSILEWGEGLKKTVRVIHEDTRQAIASLQEAPSAETGAWVAPLRVLLEETVEATEAKAEFTWTIPDHSLTDKEKVELHACMREALMNVRKHARASKVHVLGQPVMEGGYRCAVEDNGVGFREDPWKSPGRFGLRMVRDRSNRIGWTFHVERRGDWTVMEWLKQGSDCNG